MDSDKIKEIYNGWKNDLFRTPEIEALAKERAEVCSTCNLNTNAKCDDTKTDVAIKDFQYGNESRIKGKLYKGCSCPLSKKTRSEFSQCPLGKW